MQSVFPKWGLLIKGHDGYSANKGLGDSDLTSWLGILLIREAGGVPVSRIICWSWFISLKAGSRNSRSTKFSVIQISQMLSRHYIVVLHCSREKDMIKERGEIGMQIVLIYSREECHALQILTRIRISWEIHQQSWKTKLRLVNFSLDDDSVPNRTSNQSFI